MGISCDGRNGGERSVILAEALQRAEAPYRRRRVITDGTEWELAGLLTASVYRPKRLFDAMPSTSEFDLEPKFNPI